MKKNKVKFWRNISWLNQCLLKKQTSLSDWMNWPAGEVIALELGEAPTIDQLSQLHQTFGLSYRDLIEKDLAQEPNFQSSFEKGLEQRLPAPVPVPVYEIPLYAQRAGAGNAVSIDNTSNRHVAHICVPESLFAAYPGEALMAFEIDGFSMHPGVQSGDVVLGVQLKDMQNIQEGDCYIIRLANQRLLFKRAYHLPAPDRSKGLQLSSDNPDYEAIYVDYSEIESIWRFSHHLGKI